LDPARQVVALDATPDGSKWLVIDKFGLMQSIVLNGERINKDFNEVPFTTARVSPDGQYIVWMGLTRNVTEQGFDSTVTSLYLNSTHLGDYVSDYNQLHFSKSGKHWAALLPYANVYQQGERDVVIVDGTVVSKGEGRPHQFSFTADEKSWMYRATTDRIEKLVTPEVARILLQRFQKTINPLVPPVDSVVLRFSNDILLRPGMPESRDYDLGARAVLQLYRTSFKSRDTAHSYVVFHGKAQPMFRWISNIHLDTSGKHVGYLACDPKQDDPKVYRDERNAVVVIDGKIVAGPYHGIDALFMSPSGKHYAFYTSDGEFYLDGKKISGVTKAVNCVWSPDETRAAILGLSERGKFTVIANGKESPDYLRIGSIGWTPDGKNIQYIAHQNDKLLKVVQPY